MKKLSKKEQKIKVAPVSSRTAEALNNTAKQAQCCAKVSKVIAGCHD
jgi:hypothetical protein